MKTRFFVFQAFECDFGDHSIFSSILENQDSWPTGLKKKIKKVSLVKYLRHMFLYIPTSVFAMKDRLSKTIHHNHDFFKKFWPISSFFCFVFRDHKFCHDLLTKKSKNFPKIMLKMGGHRAWGVGVTVGWSRRGWSGLGEGEGAVPDAPNPCTVPHKDLLIRKDLCYLSSEILRNGGGLVPEKLLVRDPESTLPFFLSPKMKILRSWVGVSWFVTFLPFNVNKVVLQLLQAQLISSCIKII